MRRIRRWASAGIVVVTAMAVLPASAGTADDVSAADRTVTVSAAADTTYSQVPQDGDTRGLTTLATCPQSCENHAAGERQAVVSFSVAGLPAGAAEIRATLYLHSWRDLPASVTAYPAGGGAAGAGAWAERPDLGPALDTRPTVVTGRNGWDVSAAVTGNGTHTFALSQEGYDERVYWASRENSNPILAPELVISYAAAASPWTLVWSDEFNGTALDTGKWNARDDSWVDYDLACITDRPQNVSVGGGLLTLRAQRERYACGGGGTRNYTTAYLATDGGKASFKYGRFEMRAKSPTLPASSQGLWPAFWMRPDGGGNGEIDVVELPGGTKYHGAATAAIFYDYTPVKQDFRFALPASGHPADGFHRYTVDWDPTTIRWYVDGVQVWTRDRASTPWFDEVFHKAYHLRLNFQVGGWLGNPDASTAFPAEFQVDWVRVYQRQNTD